MQKCILFCIINPIITKATGKNLDISNFNYEKYINKDVIETTSQDFENNNSKLIKQAYIDNIQNDIKSKMKQKGYEVLNIEVEIIEDTDEYGKIQNVNLKLEKIENKEKNKKGNISENTIKIENVNINMNNNVINNQVSNVKEKLNISDDEKIEIIKFLSNEYSIDEHNIVIN